MAASLRYQAMDACILLVFQLDRAHIVTVEGLRDGGNLTPVQEAMVQLPWKPMRILYSWVRCHHARHGRGGNRSR